MHSEHGLMYVIGQELAAQSVRQAKCVEVLEAVKAGFSEDPGTSDLDDEQPIHVSMTLGDYRAAVRLLYQVRR